MAQNLSIYRVCRKRESVRDDFPPFCGCPAHRIPVEILQKIFFCCLTEERAPHQHLAPLLLCQICSRWRKVALQQSELWDESGFFKIGDTRTIFTESLKLWLGCLGKRQLSASIRLLPLSQLEQRKSLEVIPSQSYTDPLVQRLLLPYSNVFRALSLDMSSEAELFQFLQMTPGRLITLETLKLRFCHHLDDMSSFSAFKDAPRLKNLAIEINNDLSLGEVNTQFPWSQLTCLCLGNYVNVGTWHTIIRQCPLIQRCALGIQAMTEEDVFQNENTTFLFFNPLPFDSDRACLPSCLPWFVLSCTGRTPCCGQQQRTRMRVPPMGLTIGVLWTV
ncbi:hypothetical protein BDZ94DRAFT_1268669 [Collybia nuda]|uniref:F-box domain-containing protein n=1 Tax=Collybia nuda TaxID=64659 RepID=A0A9P5XZ12_9AGAR|nr:hypothetical protein BDZ94DRAFT_1268669 [Collybia nuda]